MIYLVAVASLKGISLSYLLPDLTSPLHIHVCKSQIFLPDVSRWPSRSRHVRINAQAGTQLPPPVSTDSSEPAPRVVRQVRLACVML